MISVRSEVQVFPGPPIFAREASEDCPVEPEGRSLGGVATSYDWQARRSRGHSSVGRAPALQAGGRRFDPVWLHQAHKVERTRLRDQLCCALLSMRAPTSTPEQRSFMHSFCLFGFFETGRALLSDIVKMRSIRKSEVVMNHCRLTSRRCLTARLRIGLETNWSF